MSKVSEIQKQIREVRKEMRVQGVRKTSCFNGGLTSAEYAFNSQLFALSLELDKAKKEGNI